MIRADKDMTLLETRLGYKLSQLQAATVLKVPLRTYVRYEKNNEYGNKLKREGMIALLNEKYEITNEKGVLSLEDIKERIPKVFDEQYNGEINFCYLFGSYAKGYATGRSDVDLLVSTSLTGLKYIGITEAIRAVLGDKTIELAKFEHQANNLELLYEIMKDGIRIY